MTTKINDFSNTGIKGKDVSWRRDVLPLLTKLQETGENVNVTRMTFKSGNHTIYRYNVVAGDIRFSTNGVATVWTFLLALNLKEVPVEKPKKAPSSKVCVIPSEVFLRELISKAVFGTLTPQEKTLIQRYDRSVMEAQDSRLLRKYSGPQDWGQWVKDVQRALLEEMNFAALRAWDEENRNEV